MLIVNGVVHTMENGVIPNGFVLVQGSRIGQVGPMSALPEDAAPGGLIDAAGGHIFPGFIDAHCHLGLYGCGGAEDDLNESPAPCTPHLRGGRQGPALHPVLRGQRQRG